MIDKSDRMTHRSPSDVRDRRDILRLAKGESGEVGSTMNPVIPEGRVTPLLDVVGFEEDIFHIGG
jgi:hypothetical protein